MVVGVVADRARVELHARGVVQRARADRRELERVAVGGVDVPAELVAEGRARPHLAVDEDARHEDAGALVGRVHRHRRLAGEHGIGHQPSGGRALRGAGVAGHDRDAGGVELRERPGLACARSLQACRPQQQPSGVRWNVVALRRTGDRACWPEVVAVIGEHLAVVEAPDRHRSASERDGGDLASVVDETVPPQIQMRERHVRRGEHLRVVDDLVGGVIGVGLDGGADGTRRLIEIARAGHDDLRCVIGAPEGVRPVTLGAADTSVGAVLAVPDRVGASDGGCRRADGRA